METCPRCQGLCIADVFIDLQETRGMTVDGFRCLNCGHVEYENYDVKNYVNEYFQKLKKRRKTYRIFRKDKKS